MRSDVLQVIMRLLQIERSPPFFYIVRSGAETSGSAGHLADALAKRSLVSVDSSSRALVSGPHGLRHYIFVSLTVN